MTEDLTTLVCLFHHEKQAYAALDDLLEAGIAKSSISLIDRSEPSEAGAGGYAGKSLDELGIPGRDHQHLLEGIEAGGMVIAVSEVAEQVGTVERIFGKNQAGKIDEAAIAPTPAAAPVVAAAPVAAVASEGALIPVVAEELVVGKRAVERGGVRVYRRTVETPVEETVNLREEHVTVNRVAVDRAVSPQELSMQGERTIELTETAEEAVVGKTARVVEEVRVGKEATEHAERIHDSVRHTEVEVEQVAASTTVGTGVSAGSAALPESDRGITRSGL